MLILRNGGSSGRDFSSLAVRRICGPKLGPQLEFQPTDRDGAHATIILRPEQIGVLVQQMTDFCKTYGIPVPPSVSEGFIVGSIE